MTEVVIDARVYDPARLKMGQKSDRAKSSRILCSSHEACSFYAQNTCMVHLTFRPCKYGRKTTKTGPTQRARGFYTWIAKEEQEAKAINATVSTPTAWNCIAVIGDYYYLPYTFMASEQGPLKSPWVLHADMTDELLDRIVRAYSRVLPGTSWAEYQKITIPKFITDLHQNAPHLFALLKPDVQARLQTISPIGRKADLKTCLPGRYTFAERHWEWDGEYLTSQHVLFAPVKGETLVRIRPDDRQPVVIQRLDQVGPDTLFLD